MIYLKKLSKIEVYTAFLFGVVFFVFTFYASGFANEIEKKFVKGGLVDIHEIDPTIKVDLVNSDPNKNYFRENFYKGLRKAYLRKEVAEKLSLAQKHLKSKYPEYSLMVMDAARPRSVSQLMYNKMKGTKFEKFVAHPKKGSMHNYGVAVDITIIDEKDGELDMGFSPFYKGDVSICWNYAMERAFHLSEKQKNNRKLLADVMKKAGFIPLSYEWWHFNGMSKQAARRTLKIIE